MIRLSDKDRTLCQEGDELGATPAANVFHRIVTEPAYKAVSAAIERAIVNGSLAPGEALPTELELCERFGVHRSTVREAIRQVEQEGLLQRGEGRRLFVCLPGVDDLVPRATRLLMLRQTTFQELWELADTLEPLAARLAARRRRAGAGDLQGRHRQLPVGPGGRELRHPGGQRRQGAGRGVQQGCRRRRRTTRSASAA
jgi:DNA-binding transcriptional regulator YhcF (GntR family)